MAATPPSGSITSPCPLSKNVCSLSQTSSNASRWRRYLSVRQSLASSTAPRPRLPWYCSSLDSKRLKRVKASAVEPANPARILSLYRRRIFLAECLMTDSPSVTCPSPARTTLPLRRMDKTIGEGIRGFVDLRPILNYISGGVVGSQLADLSGPQPSAKLVVSAWSPTFRLAEPRTKAVNGGQSCR